MSGQYQPSAAEREASEIVREFADKDPSKLDDADLKLLLERTRKEILLMDERQRVELSALGPELTERLRDKGVLTRSVMVKTFLEQFRDRLEETLKSRITSTPASLLTRVLRTAGLASVGSVLTVLLALAAGERVNEVRAREARGTADDNAIKLDLNKQREAAQAGQIAAEQQKSELEKMLNDVIRELEGEIFRLRYDLLLAKHIIYAGGFHFQDLERQLKEKEEALRLAREAEQKLRDQLAQAGLSQPDVPQPQGPIAVPVAPEGVNLEDLGQRLSEAGKSGDREQMREVVAEVLMNIESFRTLSETIRAVIIDHYTPGGTYECRISPNEGGAFSTRCDNWESFRTGSIGSPGNFLPGQFDGKRILRVKPDEVSILLALPEWIKNLWVNYYARRSQEARFQELGGMDGLSKMGEGARYFIQLTLHANGYDLNNLGLEQLSALYPEQLARREAVRTILRNHIPKVPAYLQDAFAAACTAPRAEQAGHLNPNGRFHQAFRGVIVMVQHERQKEAKGEQADPDLLFFNWGYDKDGNPIFDLTEGELHDLVHQLMDTLGDLNIPFGETGWFVRLNDARHRGSAMDFYRDPKGKLPPGHEFKSHYYLREKVRKEKASGPGGAAGPKDGWIEREADEQGRINVPGVGKIRFEK